MAKIKGTTVCINIVSSLTHLELLQYDPTNKTDPLIRRDSEELLLDPATREALDGTIHLKNTIKRLLDRNKIKPKHPVVLVLPSFFTRQYVYPGDILGEEIRSILVAEAERFYVFKKIDPAIGYCNLQGGELLYTAYPRLALTELIEAFQELKTPLVSVDCNYTATIRGLVATRALENELSSRLKWGIVIVSDFNVFMAILEGPDIEKTTETPLTLQGAEEMTVLSDIASDFQHFFGYEVLNQMIVINNSVNLSGTNMLEKLTYSGKIVIHNQNASTLSSRGVDNAQFPCSLEVLGGALLSAFPFIAPIELLDSESTKSGNEVDKYKRVSYILIGIGFFLYALSYGLGMMFDNLKAGEDSKRNTLQSSIQQARASLSVIPEVKKKLFVKQGDFSNAKYNNVMIKLGQVLPPDAWLKQVDIISSTDFKGRTITINGGTLTTDPLNDVVKELNTVVGDPPLITSIQPEQKDNQRFFTFTLNNAAAASATPAPGAPGVPGAPAMGTPPAPPVQ